MESISFRAVFIKYKPIFNYSLFLYMGNFADLPVNVIWRQKPNRILQCFTGLYLLSIIYCTEANDVVIGDKWIILN